MIRNLKIFVVAVLALAALSAIGVSGAQGAEFHCSVAPCRYVTVPDGTGKTAHMVFVIENEAKTESVTITCEVFRFSARSETKTTTELTETEVFPDNCAVNGSSGFLLETACGFIVRASGSTQIKCPAGQEVHFRATESGCVFLVPGQTLEGISFHNVGTAPNREMTASLGTMTAVEVTTPGCAPLIKTGQKLIGTFTTNNVVLTAQSDPGGAMAEAWFE